MDPRESTMAQRNAHLSPLMRELVKGDKGSRTSFCPYGCTPEDLDENGYCRHLVGFSSDDKTMEPMVMDERGRRVVVGSKREPLRKTDKLVLITVSSRVYRDVDEEARKEATRPTKSS